MKYMLMMNVPRDTGEYQISSWRPEEVEAHIGFMRDLNRELAASGEMVAVQALTAPGQARIVRAGKDGLPAVTDGPFAEAKEFLAGYWIVRVHSPGRAYEIAAKASSAPGPGGVPLQLPIEVRQVMAAPPVNA